MVSISRARRGLLPFTSPGKDHTAHRLSNLGLGHRGAVLVMYLLAGLLGTMSLFVERFSTGTTYALVGALALCALMAVVFLETAPYEKQIKLQKSSSPT
jgi:CBS domain containing-hemolysin-like protein